ncbi:conserved hypothetical protein [Chlamydia pneumoniae LPCoLN]|uniref:hypothetical protein n=1 Tax=Chlamydia pneumoniae TaxID=83558 RepID=UPI0001BD9C01|nr:hypothetical protein [Chlamydia pneumoniae]ACZ32835.1 conserved hypothetical protein [Chlamydia pneumoniae LPCoLN]
MMHRYFIPLLALLIFSPSLVKAELQPSENRKGGWPTQLSCAEGSQLFCKFEAAYNNAIEEGKPGILVFFSERPTPEFADLTNGSFSLSTPIAKGFNVVVLCPGLISPLDFFHKMDPVILYMGSFLEMFPEVEAVSGPRLCYILIDEQGGAQCQAVLPLETKI